MLMLVALQRGAHKSPVSGSRLAVGSSSSSTSGRLISDFASATRVFCPAESSPGRAFQQPAQVELLGQFLNPLGKHRHIVQMPINTQVFGHRNRAGSAI